MTDGPVLTLLVVGPTPPPLNGMTVMTSFVLTALRGKGWNVVHIDTSDHRPVGNVGRLDLQNVVLAARHARLLLRATARPGSKVLYLPIAQGNLGFLRDALFFEIARMRRLPVVVHLHGAAFGEFYSRANPAMKWLIRRCLGSSRRALVLGESVRSVFGDLVPSGKVIVVRNGIPAPVQVNRERDCRQFTVFFLSNLSPGKGYVDLLKAAVLVADSRPDIRFVIAGEWPNKSDGPRAREWVRRHGVERQVEFVRSPSGLRKAQLFRAADLFVFPARQIEGQPVVLLEAMSHSLPVVATPRGGIVDIVREDVNGVIVEAGDVPSLAGAILRLASDDDLRARLGQGGRAMYERMHTPDRMAESLHAVFNGLSEGVA